MGRTTSSFKARVQRQLKWLRTPQSMQRFHVLAIILHAELALSTFLKVTLRYLWAYRTSFRVLKIAPRLTIRSKDSKFMRRTERECSQMTSFTSNSSQQQAFLLKLLLSFKRRTRKMRRKERRNKKWKRKLLKVCLGNAILWRSEKTSSSRTLQSWKTGKIIKKSSRSKETPNQWKECTEQSSFSENLMRSNDRSTLSTSNDGMSIELNEMRRWKC